MKEVKAVKNYFWIVILFVMALAMFVPVKAEAASYRSVSSIDSSKKVDGVTFSFEYKNSYPWTYTLYVKNNGKKSLLASDVQGTIVTNGKTVYYAKWNSSGKYTVYSIKVNGSSKKKICTINGYLDGYYNGKIYYTDLSSGEDGKFCSYTIKSGKKKTIAKYCGGYMQYGKRILLTPFPENEWGVTSSIKIYNAATGKTKTLTKNMQSYCISSNHKYIYTLEILSAKNRVWSSPAKVRVVRYGISGGKKVVVKSVKINSVVELTTDHFTYVNTSGKTKTQKY